MDVPPKDSKTADARRVLTLCTYIPASATLMPFPTREQLLNFAGGTAHRRALGEPADLVVLSGWKGFVPSNRLRVNCVRRSARKEPRRYAFHVRGAWRH